MNIPLLGVILGPVVLTWIGFEFGLTLGKRSVPAASGPAPLQKFGD